MFLPMVSCHSISTAANLHVGPKQLKKILTKIIKQKKNFIWSLGKRLTHKHTSIENLWLHVLNELVADNLSYIR